MSGEAMKIPFNILAADFVGATVAGVGFAEELAHTGLVPEGLRFAHYGWFMVGFGILLMSPMVIWVVRNARNRAN